MSRSVKVSSAHLEKVQRALKQSFYPSQSALAIEVGLTRPTVSNFFNGKPVDYLNFVEISQKLGLDWQEIAARGSDDKELDIEISETTAIETVEVDLPRNYSPPDILVVDDRPDNIRLLSSMLTEQGYKVRKAVSGYMALTAVETALPDLILLDVTMPQMDGYEVCQRLKSNEKTYSIPVIFISALDEVLDKVKAFHVGGVDYITKPFQLEEVMARVDSQLTICRLQRQMQEQNHLLHTEIENRLETDKAIQEQNILLQREVQSRFKTEKLLKEQNFILQREIQNRQLAEKNLQEKNILLQQEIRDRILIETNLREKELQLEGLIGNIPGVVYRAISHRDGHVSMPYISPRAAEIFRFNREEFTENFEWIFDVAHPEDRTNLSEIVEASIQDLTPFDYEYRLPIERPDINWVRIFARPYHANNGDVVWDGVIIDITAQKKMESVYEKLLDLLQDEYAQAEQLLSTLFPHEISEHLKQKRKPMAQAFESVTVLFADIVEFTQLASHLSPTETVDLLNEVFSTFDRLTEKYNLEKIKTIGDSYMVVGGIPEPKEDHVEAIADMALDMQREIAKFKDKSEQPMSLRIGINTGTVVAGVIGSNKFAYDIWGDTVNIASRMESQGESGRIQVSEITYKTLEDKYLFTSRGTISVKGKGEMITYWLLGKK